MLVRFHREAVVEDVFGSKGGVDALMQRGSRAGRGVIVYLREGAVGVAEEGGRRRDAATSFRSAAPQRREEWREIGLARRFSATSASSRSG
jgi:3,4-dihydroxy 2-butanone 4-phosphate synthase/GTP cyclohydrolase II